MVHHTILVPRSRRRQAQVARLLALAVVPLVLVLGTGAHPDGLPIALAPVACVRCSRRSRALAPGWRSRAVPWGWRYVGRSLPPHLLQASALLFGILAGGLPGPLALLSGLPLLRWLLAVSALVWPAWGQHPCCHMLRQTLADLQTAAVLALGVALLRDQTGAAAGWAAAVMLTRPRPPKPTATGCVLDDGTYEVVLGETFAIRHKPIDEFDRRMFLLFLRDIHLVDRPSKWPFICQVWLADWFGTLQELISRWEDYRAVGDWQRLMSRRDGPLLVLEPQQALIQLWARHLWWSVAEVRQHAQAQGFDLSDDAITELGRTSGLLSARRVLRERFQLGPDLLRPKDAWLVQRLFALLDQLQARLEAGERPTIEQQRDLADLLVLRQELGLGSGRDLTRSLPWGYRMEQVLCGAWATVSDERICCAHCGTDQVRRKSRKPRTKRYYDAQGQLQTVEVYRYYCQNPVCPYQTFTNLPPDLVPYSPWRMNVHLLALQVYELGRGSYRQVAAAMDISVATAYRWVSRFGGQLLPVAALFGVVRSSGVVGVDEKWVQVPRSDKPAGKHRKWMYVYVAVDVYTYDLLHIALFPYVGSDSARAFLLALKAKG
jgi:hypothetical protein